MQKIIVLTASASDIKISNGKITPIAQNCYQWFLLD